MKVGNAQNVFISGYNQKWSDNMIEYAINKDFQNYVDKYRKSREIELDEALKHKLVQNVEDYYKEIRIAKG